MEVTDEKSSVKTSSGIEMECMKQPLMQVAVKIERESDFEAESEIDLLYADHVIKEEMVIGPEVLHKAVYNSDLCKGVPRRKEPKLHKKTNQENPQKATKKEIGTEEKITVSEADAPLHKKPRLQKQEETTDRQENANSGAEEWFATNVDSKTDASTDIQTKQKEKIQMIINEQSKISNKSKTHRKTQVKDKNVDRVTSYNEFTCSDCGDHFKSKHELMEHIESHEKIKYKVYLKCKECAYQTVTGDALERHKAVHDKSRRHVCDVCGYRFKRKDTLRTHLHRVHSLERTHECGICDYRTNNVSDLNKHLRIHTGQKLYRCSLCEYNCYTKSNLTGHIRIHSGKNSLKMRYYSCTVCEFRSIRKSNLKNHMRIHTGEKRFACTVCEYRSTSKSDLIRHMRIHTGEKRFACTVCEYRSTHNSNLIRHMRIHTGEKPFACTVCEYRCTEKSYLKNHMKIHTGENHLLVLCVSTDALKNAN